MIGVMAPPGLYQDALAELPLSTRRTESALGALVVVRGGTRWIDDARIAASSGALAVVIADPGFAASDEVRGLAGDLGLPVIVERPLLRADVVEDARRARDDAPARPDPSMVTIDVTAPRELLPIVARDALGWLRLLSGCASTLVETDGALVLLQTAQGAPVTASIVPTARPTGWMRVHLLGEVVTEVEVGGRRCRLVTSTRRGALTAPSRYESSERLTVRRALSALASGETPADLADLATDIELVECIQRIRL